MRYSVITRALAAGASMTVPSMCAFAQGGDACGQPQSIADTGTVPFDTTGASTDSSDPATCTQITRDVWFEWTAPVSGKAVISTCVPGNTMDTVLVAYADGECGSLQELACSDDEFDCGVLSTVYLQVMGGTTYRIRVGVPAGAPGGAGELTITVSGTVPNDECSGATAITGVGTFEFDNRYATTSQVAHAACGNPGRDVWFRWTAPASLPTTITTCRLVKTMESVLVLYADACPVGMPLACNDSSPRCVSQATIEFDAVAGTSYLVRVASRDGATFEPGGRFAITQDDGSGANTIIVSTAYDVVDVAEAARVEDLPGPDGEVSFREAVFAANNTPGPQTIEFAVRRSQWYYQGNVAEIINQFGYPYMLTDDGTTIDGDSQARHIGDSNPAGPDVGFWSWEPNAGNSPNIIISANNCTARGLLGVGLMGYPFRIEGSNNRIDSCQLSPALQGSVDIRSGTGNIVENCQVGLFTTGVGIHVWGAATDTVIVGNFIDGRNVGVQIDDGALRTRVGGPTLEERNIIVGVGHYGTEGFPVGTNVSVGDAPGTVIENNYIGIDAQGNEVGQNGTTGLALSSGAENAVVRNNVISGVEVRGANHYSNQIFGIGLSSNARGAIYEGNIIGADPTGTIAIPNYRGVAISSSTGATFARNTVAFNTTRGLVVAGETAIRISENSIHENGGLGIDLAPIGLNPNDPGDGDGGANLGQNFPVIATAETSSAITVVTGTLDSTPLTTFVIEVFASAACDPSGYGEGEEFLGSELVTTDATGHATFTLQVAPTTPGRSITSTATNPDGNTSEFSACVPAVIGEPPCAADWDGSGDIDSNDFFAFLTGFFAGAADFNGSGTTDSQDLFDFLAGFFAGC